jgi:hypothetical protein
MAAPVVGKNVGSGIDNLRAEIVKIVQAEIAASQRNGIGVPLNGALGTLDNMALSSPIVPQAIYNITTGFALAAAGGNIVTYPVTVPAGFTTAIVTVTAEVYAINTRAVTDTFGVRPTINTAFPSATASRPIVAGGYDTVVAPFNLILNGLTPGGTFNIYIYALSGTANWASNISNEADLIGLILWQR